MARKLAEPARFETEAALCAAFIAWAQRGGHWTAYAECEGWDVLLVHGDGTQIGVQAKLRFGMDVVEQAIETTYSDGTGPDFRAILVPCPGREAICDALGLTIIRPDGWRVDSAIEFFPSIDASSRWQGWHFWNPARRHTLPEYVPDVPAGVPSPSPLTKWKIAALQICAVMEIRGYVTREDFRRASIDHRRWIAQWLDPVPDQPGRWKWRGSFAGFAAQHVVVYPQVRAKVVARGLAAGDLAG